MANKIGTERREFKNVKKNCGSMNQVLRELLRGEHGRRVFSVG